MAKTTDSGLTDKQERFCQEYCVDMNATQAAIRAGYSEKGARVRGTELLAIRNITERVKELQGDLEERTTMSKLDLIEGVQNLAKGADTDNVRLRAHELLMKYHGMLTERLEHSGTGFVLKIIDADSIEPTA